jgi:hypothetical protein
MTTPNVAPRVAPSAPPRITERLLESLGADPDFRDALLGDMAEELAIRAAWDGERAARRWYRREALRVAPHLLRDRARGLGWRGAARLAGVVMTAYVLSTLVTLPVSVLTVRLVPTPGELPAWAIALLLVLRVVQPLLAGWIAAALDEEAPVVAALALGVAGSVGAQLFFAVVVPEASAPLWLGLVRMTALTAAVTLGGVLRVWVGARRGERSRRSAAQ